MLTREQLRELEALDAGEASVLSVYLQLGPEPQVRRSFRVVFADLADEARAQLGKAARERFAAEVARVQSWLDGNQPRGNALALFSCQPRGLWQTYVVQVPLGDQLAFEPRPDVVPLLKLLDDNERYAVALVDKERARLFTVFLGEIEESEAFLDAVPGKHARGGFSQKQIQRHHDQHVRWHLEHVAKQLTALFQRQPFDRLIVAGPAEATSDLRHLLPHALAQRLVAMIPAQTTANLGEVLEMTLAIERRVEGEAEERLVRELLDAAQAGLRATSGLEPTLESLWLRKVRTLAVADGLRSSGSECTNCAWLEAGEVAQCPACGSPMRPVHDLFHRAMEQALEQDGSVEVVHGKAAQRLMEAGDGLGAIVRY
jgi:peptide chain release factor subunit 1